MDDESEPLRIDWARAEVHDNELTVPVGGTTPRRLARHFDGVRALIEPKAGNWGEIRVRKATIEVGDVQQGAEQELRHLLDSVITQINADLGRGPDAGAQPDGAASEDAQQQADTQMSERFRAFAEDTEQTS